ncbi:MAG TPA: ABC transporter substrate-binding protein [Streptosporangiaceae bacterium]|nr:ABC transporter substrate-binding protein [Streptosporangiaceae bacterium]
MTRRRITIAAAGVVAVTLLATACGRSLSSADSSAGNISPTANLVTTTPAGAKTVPQAVWAVYRDVNSLDPAFAFDYPENTAISLMCESLLLQKADGAIVPGLASLSTPNQKTLVFTINPKASFWDGHPVTPADVVYSLDRQMNPSLGGFYGQVFSRVKTIEQTGQDQVTITLNQPDYWLEGELSSMAGVVIEKAYAQQEGKNYGTPAGGVMCTGPYQLKSWSPSAGVVAVANPHYWRGTTPLVQQITLSGVPDNNDLTAGLETGAIQGTYASGGIPTLDQLRRSSAVKVYQGPGWATDAMIISAATGPLANVKVRQALSLAVNRQSIINAVYKGAALMPKWLANPGAFGYGTSVFDRAYQASPALTENLAEAKKLIAQAGVAGQTITIGTSSEVSSIAFEAAAYQQAAVAIGLKVTLKSVSAQDFINFFTDPSYRKGVDMFPTVNYGDYADPAALLDTVAVPGADQNYDNYSDPQMTALLGQARSTANPDQRAALVAKAEERAAQTLPWIPTVDPTNVLVMSSKLTGATGSFAYMFAPWANSLGGVG